MELVWVESFDERQNISVFLFILQVGRCFFFVAFEAKERWVFFSKKQIWKYFVVQQADCHEDEFFSARNLPPKSFSPYLDDFRSGVVERGVRVCVSRSAFRSWRLLCGSFARWLMLFLLPDGYGRQLLSLPTEFSLIQGFAIMAKVRSRSRIALVAQAA